VFGACAARPPLAEEGEDRLGPHDQAALKPESQSGVRRRCWPVECAFLLYLLACSS
jgi:hypothetical protein